MKQIGQVKAILNERLLLVVSQEELSPDDQVTVFASIESEELKNVGFEQPLLYPKGQLRVICPQGNNIYLVERFREINRKIKRITNPNLLTSNWMSLALQLKPETKEIEEEVPGRWSAELDEKQMLNLKFSTTVTVGDLIGSLS